MNPPAGYRRRTPAASPGPTSSPTIRYPDGSKWAVAKARETIKDPTYWERPENIGQYRDDRRNVFLDGESNLVLRAAKDGSTYYSLSLWRGGVGQPGKPGSSWVA